MLWLAANQLSLIAANSKYMHFYKPHKRIQFPILTISNTEIQRVESFNCLRITIDQNLKLTEHVNYLCNKISETIGVMNKLNQLSQEPAFFFYITPLLYHT